MAKDPMYYANRHTARAQNRTAGGTQSVPVSGRHGPTIDLAAMKGKTTPKGGSGGLASRQIEAPIQETGPEAMSITDGEASTQPQMVTETQQPIENRGGSARYMIQGGGPKIDLSFLVPERANKAFDPSKAIGGENVPFQESKGVGGFLRRMLGDESNQKNIEYQQAQGAEWRQDAKEQKAEDRILNRMREGDKPTAERFTKQLAENKAIRDEEYATRLRERGEDTATRKGEREQDRVDRLARETEAEKVRIQERQDRLAQQLQENAFRDTQIGFQQTALNKPRFKITPTGQGGAIVFNESEGNPVGTFSPPTMGEKVDPKTGAKSFVSMEGGYKPYVAPVKAPINPNPGSNQVNRGTGGTGDTLGGPLPTDTEAVVTPPRNSIMSMDESTRPSPRMVPVQEEQSIDPYQLQRTTPSMGTMMEPAGDTLRRRARYLSPNMPGWSLGQ